MTFVERRKTNEYLHGHWRDAVTVQVLVLFSEIILFAGALWLPGADIPVMACALLIDLLMVSPLKAGRAFYFETLIADRDAARISLIFRYYRHGYERAVGWRMLLWGARLTGSAVLCLPTLCLFVYSGILQHEGVLSMALFGSGLLLLAAALVGVEIVLFRYTPVPYLLSHPGGLRGAVSLSKRMMSGRINTLTMMYLDHAVWLPAYVLILPWFYTSVQFQVARAATVRRFLRQIPSENVPHHLQPRKKYGRMGRNSN